MEETLTYPFTSYWNQCCQSLGDSNSGHLDLKLHHLALAIVKKTLDENCLQTYPEDHIPYPIQISMLVTEYSFKNKQPGKWNLKWRAGYRIISIECTTDTTIHIENQAYRENKNLQYQRCCTGTTQLSYGMWTQHLAELENL